MIAKVEPYLHEDLEAMGFQRIRSLVEVALNNGAVLTRETSTSRGTPDRPMTREELADKFRDCAEHSLSPQRQQQVLDTIYQLEKMENMGTLMGLLRG